MNEVRIDKWLWATRVFKTRSIASDACKKGRVILRGVPAKPSTMIKVGDKVQVRKPPITLTFEVLKLSQNRMGAKLVPEYLKNVTPKEEYEVLELQRISGFVNRARGTGRPTKKERRDLEQFMAPADYSDFWDEITDDYGDEEEYDEWDDDLLDE